ncbi:hypothetical protein HOLleu_04625 [Holothuria leucospilota]|uniref:HTH CENPB-type domain-containing protein n=1 Tax=Holothuria leucospilota TaxID=206669 RepID=A0A9Q1CTK0_HOLLE|nr:hypothetical protein HOLleu_04625 [Holothuria leucospilota]
MVRNYKRKTDRGRWDAETMKLAVECVRRKEMGVKTAAKVFNLPKTTLHRKARQDPNNAIEVPLGRRSILGADIEEELCKVVKTLTSRGLALASKDLQELAYEVAERKGLSHNFNPEKKRAGRFWLEGFLKRHPEISVKKAERLARKPAMDRDNSTAGSHVDMIREVLDEYTGSLKRPVEDKSETRIKVEDDNSIITISVDEEQQQEEDESVIRMSVELPNITEDAEELPEEKYSDVLRRAGRKEKNEDSKKQKSRTKDYKRKTDRASWDVEVMKLAVYCVREKDMGVKRAAKVFNLPKSTLRRKARQDPNNAIEVPLGRRSILGADMEEELCRLVKALESRGLRLGSVDLQELAYQLAEHKGLSHSFNQGKKRAGREWLRGFLKRHPDISVILAKGVTRACVDGLNHSTVRGYSGMVEKVLVEQTDLFNPAEDA